MKQCLKWYNVWLNKLTLVGSISSILDKRSRISYHNLYSKYTENKRYFHVKTNEISRLKSDLRIGPHNEDVVSVLIGSILGDSHLERRNRGLGTRVIFEQCNRNVEYLMWFHNFFSSRGYCSTNKPKLITRIKKHNKVFHHYRVSSYTFTSLNWLHEMFYQQIDSRFVKIIPQDLEKYLTPLALAIWFMDDGSKINKTVRIATNCFQISDLECLCTILKIKYNLDVSIQKGGVNKGNILYIKTNSLTTFINIVKPYMLPSMLYKLGL